MLIFGLREISMKKRDAADSSKNNNNDHQVGVDDQPASKGRRDFLGKAGGLTAATIAAGLVGIPAVADEVKASDLSQELHTSFDSSRVERAFQIRMQAALNHKAAPLPDHVDNGDELRYQNRIANYSKGMPHNQNGEVDLNAYGSFLTAIQTRKPDDFEQIPMGGSQIRFKNPQAGLTFEFVGPDPGHMYMPPPPAFSSAEIAGEIVENYWMAICRDVFFLDYDSHPLTNAAAADLSKFTDFRGPRLRNNLSRSGLSNQAAGGNSVDLQRQVSGSRTLGASFDLSEQNAQSQLGRAPIRNVFSGPVQTSALFRGLTPGDLTGPYISQFLWTDIRYGVQTISQRMRTPIPGDDYLTSYSSWLTAQNTLGDLNIPNQFDITPRYIRNARDIGEWVHIDVLFQAYFNATLILLGMNAPADENNPYNNSRTQYPFGTFGPTHIQSLVCTVASNALRSVWYQKWYVHRRLRPEEFAGRLHNHITKTAQYPINNEIFNSTALEEVNRRNGTYLLPQAFPEGCPTHPAYGAGHATVAGACVTVLKAWFDESWVIPDPVVPTPDGLSLVPYQGPDLTVGGELNKLASNIALGRNIAGVHWRSDATESLKLGEAIAISILQDQKGCYNENFQGFTLTKFDGSRITI